MYGITHFDEGASENEAVGVILIEENGEGLGCG
jgi:hypothetical protein